jgi:hypothetical protein
MSRASRAGGDGGQGHAESSEVVRVGGVTFRRDIWEAALRSTESEPPLPDEVVIEFVRVMDELAAKRRRPVDVDARGVEPGTTVRPLRGTAPGRPDLDAKDDLPNQSRLVG